MISGGRKQAALLFLNFGPFSVKIYVYAIWGLQGGSAPLPKKILYFAS